MNTHWSKKKAESAALAIPPAWGLEATVAVNPFLGQREMGLADTAALWARVSGTRIFPDRNVWREKYDAGHLNDDDLVEALLAAGAPIDLAELKKRLKREPAQIAALPSLAELARDVTGVDWPAIIAERVSAFASAAFDQGQALWAQPGRASMWDTWRGWARRDLTPEIHGLVGFAGQIAELPVNADAARAQLCDALGLTEASAQTAFHRLLADLGGWAQYARHLQFEAEKAGGTDPVVTDLLTIRLAFEAALLAQFGDAISEAWASTVAAHEADLRPNGDHIIDAILQDASERAAQRELATTLNVPNNAKAARPDVQMAFCIDVRSEVFRRALEQVSPSIETLGFAGFFGLGVAHKGFASDVCEARLPVLLNAQVVSTSAGGAEDAETRYVARAKRAWGRFKHAAVSSFAFVEAAGPIFGAKLVKDTLGGAEKREYGPTPRFDETLTAEARVDAAAAVLGAMSLTNNFAKLVVLAGHGAHVANNPHESALHCGACGGYAGDVNARLLAGLLNDDFVRHGLRARGIELPADTHFIAAIHETTTDHVHLFVDDQPSETHERAIATLKAQLGEAGEMARGERSARLPRAKNAGSVAQRADDWSETRAEWGLAGANTFIAARRDHTRGRDLQGRAFLHSYDWEADEGFGVLELIMTAPVVVASWISLQYYGSTVAPRTFGGGNKVLHNVVGGIGVVEGNSGPLMAGLPLQSVHDGENFMHDPLRLSVAIEAPRDAMSDILKRHKGVADLFDNGWLTLFAMDDTGQLAWRYVPGGDWIAVEGARPESARIEAIAAE